MDRPKTCGNCRFKGEEIRTEADEANGWEGSPTGYFPCTRIKHDPSKICPKGEGAVIIDGSGYHAQLRVEADFGCVKYEPQAQA